MTAGRVARPTSRSAGGDVRRPLGRVERTSTSANLNREARQLMPAGVSSPVRSYDPFPRTIVKGRGSRITDADGNRYVDYCLAFGPLLLGHSHPAVVAAVGERIRRGAIFGAPCEEETELARMVRRRFPSVESMRFVTTGSEATAHALRLARGFTGRDLIVKVEGGYHGAHDAVLVRSGSGGETFGVPDSAGVPRDVARLTLTIPFNDADAAERLFASRGNEIAALIVEPVLANVGPILPEKGYLELLRKLTSRHASLLVFDEIVTGFRLAAGGAQELYGVRPDLTTLGKVLGGGLPLAAFGGRRDVMEMLAPLGNVYQAGTYAGNPLSLAAGIATLTELDKSGTGAAENAAAEIRSGLRDIAEDVGVACAVAGVSSLFQLFFTENPVRSYADVKRCDAKLYMEFFRRLLDSGVYLPPSQFETCFTSNAHSTDDVSSTLEAMEEALGGLTR